MAREIQRARAVARLMAARAALEASPTDGTARVRVEHAARVVLVEDDMERRRLEFVAGG
jgi:hypothetical protein